MLWPALRAAWAKFFSPGVTGDASITPFKVDVRAMKTIQGIDKGETALLDIFGTNIFKTPLASQDLSRSYGHNGVSVQHYGNRL